MNSGPTMKASNKARYEQDVIAWANQQAEFLRSGQFSELDLEHLAEEIEDVGKSEQRELASRMAVLLAHLLKWDYQSKYRGSSWQATIRGQRKLIKRRMNKTPSLKATITDSDWIEDMWDDACRMASKETGISRTVFPEECPWSMERTLDDQFWPDD